MRDLKDEHSRAREEFRVSMRGEGGLGQAARARTVASNLAAAPVGDLMRNRRAAVTSGVRLCSSWPFPMFVA